MNIKLNFKTSPELEKNLKTINEKILKEAKKIIIETALVDVESEAKNKLTAGGHVVTGRLRASIHTEYEGQNRFSYKANEIVASKKKYKGKIKQSMKKTEFDGSLKVKPKETNTYFEVYVGTNVEYSQKIERLDAYLYPSFLSAQNKLKQRLKKLLKNVRGV